MPPGRRNTAATTAIARLTVLAASDEPAFVALARDLLASRERLTREAALDVIAEHPAPALRDPLRSLYFSLAADGLKRDAGARMRSSIVRALTAIRDVRDGDLALHAAGTREGAFGDDLSWQLRAYGLRMLARIAPQLMPFIAVELLDDLSGPNADEPAATALELLAAAGHDVAIYQ